MSSSVMMEHSDTRVFRNGYRRPVASAATMMDQIQTFLRVLILGTLALEARAENGPLQRLPFQRWVETLSPDGKQVLAISPPKKRAVDGRFSLSSGNITTEITDAYRYGDNLVVFGWSGHSNGIVTVTDAINGKEKLELLVDEQFRVITPSGAIVYAHWFVPGAFERSDSVWLLDLNRPFPEPKFITPGVANEVGFQIYPASISPKGQHTVVGMLKDDSGRTVYLADVSSIGTESKDICFVAIEVSNLNKVTNRCHCTDESSLVGHQSNQIGSRDLTVTTSGGLLYSVSVGGKAATTERFNVDPATLTASKIPIKSTTAEEIESGPRPLLVPWSVENQQSIAPGNRIDLKASAFANHENDSIMLDLLINESGRVIRATASGSTKELRQQLETSGRAWSFKPTILDGPATRVHVKFEGLLKDLGK